MKEITISIDEDVYRVALAIAARQRISLNALVQEVLTRLRAESGLPESEFPTEPQAEDIADKRERREEIAQFFANLNAQPRQDGPSVGPLNREELYQRGIRGY